MKFLISLRKCESGATAIEYALIGSLVSIAILVGVMNYSNSIDNLYSGLSNSYRDATD